MNKTAITPENYVDRVRSGTFSLNRKKNKLLKKKKDKAMWKFQA